MGMRDSLACDCDHPSKTTEHTVRYGLIRAFNKPITDIYNALNATLAWLRPLDTLYDSYIIILYPYII